MNKTSTVAALVIVAIVLLVVVIAKVGKKPADEQKICGLDPRKTDDPKGEGSESTSAFTGRRRW